MYRIAINSLEGLAYKKEPLLCLLLLHARQGYINDEAGRPPKALPKLKKKRRISKNAEVVTSGRACYAVAAVNVCSRTGSMKRTANVTKKLFLILTQPSVTSLSPCCVGRANAAFFILPFWIDSRNKPLFFLPPLFFSICLFHFPSLDPSLLLGINQYAWRFP